MPKPVIVFDLDGTLIDTAPDLLDSLNHCLTQSGHEAAQHDDLRQLVGHGARVMITRALTTQGKPAREEEISGLFDLFLEHYASNMPGRSRPYPGALDAVERFLSAGYRAAICTNKYQSLSETLMGSLGLETQFAAICGADRFEFRKPDPRHLTGTIRLAGGAIDGSIMIGDSRTDIDTAKAAGIPVVAVDWGYTDHHVSKFEPDTIISHFDELTPTITRRLHGRRTAHAESVAPD
ncbi:MAG: phosphoglycolate phosphatase [Rhizobiaceae bacterium]